MDGKGLFQWPDGRVYFGQFRAGQKQGKGMYMWPNGQYYEGDFKEDECNGMATLYYPDGKTFNGAWKDGKKHGKGVYTWPNEARYHVQYMDGLKVGEGKLDNSQVSLTQLKDDYKSLAKKSYGGERALGAVLYDERDRGGRGKRARSPKESDRRASDQGDYKYM
jgi:hypothetical protein